MTARTIKFFFFFRHFLAPEKGQNTAIFGPTDFFSAVHACRGVHAKKKKRSSTQKTPKISKKLSPTASNTVNGPCNQKDLYFWHIGIMYEVCASCVVCVRYLLHKENVLRVVDARIYDV